MAHYRTINVKAADKAAFINYCETIDSTEIEGFTFLLQNNKQKAEPKIEIKEVEKPLGNNQQIITISEKCLQLMTFDPNVKLLEKYKLTNLSDLANAAMEKFLKDLK